MKKIGSLLMIGGGILLGGYGLYQLLDILDIKDLPPVILWGLLAVLSGLVLLVLSLIRERIRDRKEEEKDVDDKH
ncbi:MAG: hypothetical protein ACYC2T_01285 [Bacillota bacterium]